MSPLNERWLFRSPRMVPHTAGLKVSGEGERGAGDIVIAGETMSRAARRGLVLRSGAREQDLHQRLCR